MFRFSLIAIPLLLAGCSGAGGEQAAKQGDTPTEATETGNDSASIAAAEADLKAQENAPAGATTAAMPLQPGEWEVAQEIVGADVPGAPVAALGEMIGKKNSYRHCLTPAEAANPQGDFFNGANPDASCRQQNFSMTGGRINIAMTCDGPQGAMQLTMDGRYQPASYTMDATISTNGIAAGQKMTITSRVTGRRTGACPASSNGAAGAN